MEKLIYTGERYVPGQTAVSVQKDHQRRYRYIRNFVRGQRILDVACGSGFGIKILSAVSDSIVGVDYSFEAVNFARRSYMRQTKGIVQADAQLLPFRDDSFDAIVSFETIEHLRHPKLFLKEVRRVLRVNGIFFISTPVKKTERLDQYHFREYSIDEFVKLVSGFFSIEKAEGQRFMFSPLFFLFSLEFVNSLKKISFVKEFYRRCYGRDEIKPLTSAGWFTPNFILVTCKNEK